VAPLSEDEQKILDEIEQNLYADDPRLGVQGRASGIQVIRIGALIALAGFGLLIGFLISRSLLVGVLAFIAMVGGIVLVTGGVRQVATARDATPIGARERVTRTAEGWGERLRQRFKRP
jgi:Protein of unknown function (DUF3040)